MYDVITFCFVINQNSFKTFSSLEWWSRKNIADCYQHNTQWHGLLAAFLSLARYISRASSLPHLSSHYGVLFSNIKKTAQKENSFFIFSSALPWKIPRKLHVESRSSRKIHLSLDNASLSFRSGFRKQNKLNLSFNATFVFINIFMTFWETESRASRKATENHATSWHIVSHQSKYIISGRCLAKVFSPTTSTMTILFWWFRTPKFRWVWDEKSAN